nr:MAG TPA: hypothetical protein [Caudoviricetes sp.]
MAVLDQLRELCSNYDLNKDTGLRTFFADGDVLDGLYIIYEHIYDEDINDVKELDDISLRKSGWVAICEHKMDRIEAVTD